MNDNDNNLIFLFDPIHNISKFKKERNRKKNLGHMLDYREKLFSMLSIYLFTFSLEKKAINTKKKMTYETRNVHRCNDDDDDDAVGLSLN